MRDFDRGVPLSAGATLAVEYIVAAAFPLSPYGMEHTLCEFYKVMGSDIRISRGNDLGSAPGAAAFFHVVNRPASPGIDHMHSTAVINIQGTLILVAAGVNLLRRAPASVSALGIIYVPVIGIMIVILPGRITYPVFHFKRYVYRGGIGMLGDILVLGRPGSSDRFFIEYHIHGRCFIGVIMTP